MCKIWFMPLWIARVDFDIMNLHNILRYSFLVKCINCPKRLSRLDKECDTCRLRSWHRIRDGRTYLRWRTCKLKLSLVSWIRHENILGWGLGKNNCTYIYIYFVALSSHDWSIQTITQTYYLGFGEGRVRCVSPRSPTPLSLSNTLSAHASRIVWTVGPMCFRTISH